MPPYLPWHFGIVILSGVIEIGLGIAFLFAKTRKLAARGIIALLIAVLPAHIHMIQDAAVLPDVPLWVLYARLPIQALLGLFAWSLAKQPKESAANES